MAYCRHTSAGWYPYEHSECLVALTPKPELRCWDGPPAFAGAESGFAGVTIGLATHILHHPFAGATIEKI